MGFLKNAHLLTDVVTEKDLEAMEQAAEMHAKFSGIFFKILTIEPKRVVIRITQERNSTGIYHSDKRLREIVEETFGRFFPGRKVLGNAIPHEPCEADHVDAKWIQAKMLATETRIKDISRDTGIDRTQLTAVINGLRPLSQPMKALFYFYFLAKESVGTKQS